MSNSLFVALLALIASGFRTRAVLQAEILALRHQLAVLQANAPRHLRLKRSDRVLWLLLWRFWSGWCPCLKIVQPATVVAWHRRSLRRTLQRYFAYYESCRTHLSLTKDAPLRRPVQPPALGKVNEIPQVGGLHHLYIRKAA